MKRFGTLALALVAVTSVWAVVACDVATEFMGEESDAPDVLPARPPEPRYTVEVAPVVRTDLEARLEFVGTLEGKLEVDVVPNVAGRLEDVHVELGDRVRLGQPIAQIRDDDLATHVLQAEHAYEVARATVRQREVDLELAETTRRRSQQMFDRGLIAREEFDDAASRAAAQTAQVDLARAQFAQNGARVEEVRITLEDATIRSPVDGFVARRELDPGAFATTSTPVVSVVDIQRVKLVAQVVERDFRRVRAGAPTRMSVEAYPLETFEGVVARVAPVLDPTTRTAEVEVEIPNDDVRLKPGMYARVEVTTERRPQALVVPRNAVVERAGVSGVFTVRQTGASEVATFVAVEVGLQDTVQAEILAGVAEGESVITTGAAGLADGEPVTVLRGTRALRLLSTIQGGAPR